MIQLSLDDYIKSVGGIDILTLPDAVELIASEHRVFMFMRDREWHSASSIRQVAGGSEGLRRMRSLRRYFVVERRRGTGREFEYRLKAR